MRHRLFHVFDGDQADAAILIVDDDELLDAMLMQHPLGLVLADALAHRDEVLVRHQLGDFLPGIGGEAHVAVGENADQLAGLAIAAGDHGNAGDAVILHQRQRVRQRRVRPDGQRVHHHARLVLLDLPHLDGLRVRIEVAMDDADAAGLRHGDRHPRLGDGVHGGGDDRDVEGNGAGDAGADVDVGRQHIRKAGLQQHVVEGIGLGKPLKIPAPSSTPSGGQRPRCPRDERHLRRSFARRRRIGAHRWG